MEVALPPALLRAVQGKSSSAYLRRRLDVKSASVKIILKSRPLKGGKTRVGHQVIRVMLLVVTLQK